MLGDTRRYWRILGYIGSYLEVLEDVPRDVMRRWEMLGGVERCWKIRRDVERCWKVNSKKCLTDAGARWDILEESKEVLENNRKCLEMLEDA